jgi:hypothetical protein
VFVPHDRYTLSRRNDTHEQPVTAPWRPTTDDHQTAIAETQPYADDGEEFEEDIDPLARL